jgi:hypothetical protein
MNLDRWNMLARVMRAPADVPGTAAAAPADTGTAAAAAPGSETGTAAAAPASDTGAAAAAPVASPSPLAGADAAKREGAPAPAKESAPAAESAGDTKTPAKAGEVPPPGGTEGKDAAKPEGDGAAKPDAAAGEGKDAKAGETAEKKPEGADAAADKKPESAEAPPAPPPVYEAYKLPETLKLDETRLKEFNTILGEAELNGKADHAAMQQLGQKVMDLYAGEVQRIGEQVMKYQVDTWNRHLETELNVLKSDPALGGNRIDTTLGNAKYVLEQFGGSKDEQDRFMATLDRSGVSSNRDFVALLNRMFERYREPEPVSPNLPSVKARVPGQRSWYDTVDVGGAKA